MSKNNKFQVIFVLGGPGVGKGTQCEKITTAFPKWASISVGDLLREERKNNPTSEESKIIEGKINMGEFVPVEIVIRVLKKAMKSIQQKSGQTRILLDGFPRNQDNLMKWNTTMRDYVCLRGVLFFKLPTNLMIERVLGRAKATRAKATRAKATRPLALQVNATRRPLSRSDDTEEVVRKRILAYQRESEPIVKAFIESPEVKVASIDSNRSIDAVWDDVKQCMITIEGELGRSKL